MDDMIPWPRQMMIAYVMEQGLDPVDIRPSKLLDLSSLRP